MKGSTRNNIIACTMLIIIGLFAYCIFAGNDNITIYTTDVRQKTITQLMDERWQGLAASDKATIEEACNSVLDSYGNNPPDQKDRRFLKAAASQVIQDVQSRGIGLSDTRFVAYTLLPALILQRNTITLRWHIDPDNHEAAAKLHASYQDHTMLSVVQDKAQKVLTEAFDEYGSYERIIADQARMQDIADRLAKELNAVSIYLEAMAFPQ